MRYALTIWTIILLHIAWGIFLFLNGAPLYTTSIDGIVRFFHPYQFSAAVLIFAGLCGILGVRLFEKNPSISLALFTPMQFLLLLSELTVLQAIWKAHFADGVIRSRYFIAADQVYILIIGALFTYCIFINYNGLKKLWNTSTGLQ